MNFPAPERVHELLAFVEGELAQLALVANYMRSQEDDEVVFLLVGALVAEQVADHRDVGDERNALVVERVLAGEQAADNRGAMVLDQDGVEAERMVVVGPSVLLAVPLTTLETSSYMSSLT